MPALAFHSFIESNSVRSVPWSADLNARAVDILQIRNVPRAEVSVDLPTLNSIDQAITAVFGNVQNVDSALTALAGATGGNTLNIADIQSAASSITSSSNALDSSINEVLPRLEGAFTGAAAASVAGAVDEVNKASNDFKSTVSGLQNSVNQVVSTASDADQNAAQTFSKRQEVNAKITELVTEGRASLLKMQDALKSVQSSLQSAIQTFNSADTNAANNLGRRWRSRA
ncbi:hypothetical protein DL96DRAFT_1623926 [Flagelloscypha sp. PMI_526]|nr:hypothetical protein DL96DRAFT_1623926 [Flagelloscypha sp. PMI_526]